MSIQHLDRPVVDLETWPSRSLLTHTFCIAPAAWALTHLYASMLAQARGIWANEPPQHTLDFVFGGIRMVMHCPQQPIPWGFVGNFAERLLHITSGGWTGLYKIMLSHAESQVNFVVLLSVVPPVGQ